MSVAEFDRWANYALTSRDNIRLLSIMILIIFARNLLLLESKFPAFGMLFHTLSRSKKEITVFSIVIKFFYT